MSPMMHSYNRYSKKNKLKDIVLIDASMISGVMKVQRTLSAYKGKAFG